MAQVRIEYLRWIVPFLWETGSFYNLPEEGFRRLKTTTLPKFRQDCLLILKSLDTHRFMEIRDKARVWLFSNSLEEQQRVLRIFDEESTLVPAPYRVDWTKNIRVVAPGDLLDKRV